MKRLLCLFAVFVLLIGCLSSCEKSPAVEDAPNENAATENGTSNANPMEVDFSKTDAEMFTDGDRNTEYNVSEAVTIQLNGTTATASDGSVKISGSTVTITEEATYVISGSLTDGMLIVNASDTAKPHLVFNGVEVTSKTSAALYILEADKVFVTLAEGTSNTLANGGAFTAIDDNTIDAALFSKGDLTLNGSGTLTVTSPAGHGIVCKDDLVVTGGSYTVLSASHGFDANDSVRIAKAELHIDAGKDLIHCENADDASLGFIYVSSGTITGEAEGDGIAAGSYLQIEGGIFDLLVGGGSENGSKASSDNYGGFMGGGHGGMPPGEKPNASVTAEDTVSMKGLKAANSLLIADGTFAINSADDSIHSDVSVIINGGTFDIACGDDAVHAEEQLTVTAGTMNITECYEGLEALHIKVMGGDIKLVADDDGLNAAGGNDQSGTAGGRDGMFGGQGDMGGGHGGMGGGMPSENGSVVISGGNLYIYSSGDGIDANGTLAITGGYTVVVGPTQGDTATLDYDKSAVISGGTFIGTGASGMAQSFSDSKQGVIALRTGNSAAGTKIILKDKNGKTIIEHTPELNFAVVILSSPDIVKGETYSLTIGSQTEKFEAT